jgi:hypothetical protein
MLDGQRSSWTGKLIAIQPRIRLMRSFDQRHHGYLGYVLTVDGTVGGEKRSFHVGIGKVAQAKHEFRVGDEVSGEAEEVADREREVAEFYKASKLKITSAERSDPEITTTPPFHGLPPPLEVYRARGHRRLSVRTYDTKCTTCLWGCCMSVEMIVDQWNPRVKKYRFETFCYGPKSCSFYAAGPKRQVPGRRGMSHTEEDWVDEEATRHRGPDE